MSPVYSVRWSGPEQLVQGRDNAVTCPVRLDGETPTVSAASVALYRGTVPVAAVAASVLNPPAATLLAPSLATESRGPGYTIRWTLTIDGVSHTFDRPAVIVRRTLFPVVAEADLTELHPHLSQLLPSGTTLQQWIDASWSSILNRLVAEGILPDTIIEPYALRDLHRFLALHMMFMAWGSSLRSGGEGNQWAVLADKYEGKHRDAWRSVNWLVDANRDGAPDSNRRRRAGRAQIMTVEIRPNTASGVLW